MAAIEQPSNWTTETMDYILHEGDKLYSNIDVGNELLLPSDLPTCVHINNKVYQIVRGKEAFGSFVENVAETRKILFALCTFIQKTMTSALLCVGDKMGASAIAILSVNTSFFIFDAHSRNNCGMPCPDGTSVLMQFSDVDETVSYICELADSLSAMLFHWTFWHALPDHECDCISTGVPKSTATVDILSQDDILKLYTELVRETSQCKKRTKYYASYKRRVRKSETCDETVKRRECDKKHKQILRANETQEQTKRRQNIARIQMCHNRLSKKLKCETIQDAMNNFKEQCKKQPVYICTSCHRLLWEKGVEELKIEKYNNVSVQVTNLVLADKHRISSTDGLTYICHSCHKTLKSGRIPAQSKANLMDLEEIPDELKDLNNLELHTICKRILFMKLVKLPRGKQKGIKGAAVNVPADLGPACCLLPRIPTDAHIISLKLKRKLQYKQAYLHDTIRPEKVIAALQYLKNNNPEYSDININENWIQQWHELDEELFDGIFEIEESEHTNQIDTAHEVQISDRSDKVNGYSSDVDASDTTETRCSPSTEEEKEDMIAMEENCKLRDLPYDTCLQSELPEEANQIFSIAPGEGSKPIPLLTDKLFEELSNPDKFPSGKGGYASTTRDPRLTLTKYVNARLLDQDGRFARDIEYIFGMQYAVEHKQVRDTINIALRQTRGRQQLGRNLDAGMLKNPQLLHNLFKKDRAYSFLKNIRGSPPYWQKMFYEVLAMIRTLGIPTWFLTLSAADMKWPEVIQSIAQQYGTIYTEDEVLALPWQMKSTWLRSNPVTAARMFQYRLETFVTTFLKSNANPIGCITEYVIRIEFQARGSPHAHTLFWIKDAPKLGYSDDTDVKSFIDNYVSCSLPETDKQLRDLVESLQVHRHSQSCRRKAGCRFKYPKPPSPCTLISREPQDNCQQQIDFAVKILTAVKQVLQNKDLPVDVTLDDVLTAAHVTLEDYTKALCISKSGDSIILKRDPTEQNVNCYSPTVLKTWLANMDIQYVINAYACVMYIASYVLKAEKGMGELLKQAAKELQQGNTRQQLSKLGSVFLTNREVSAQEAVYRVLSMPLRKCSRTTIFINTDHKDSRDSLLLPFTQLQKLNDDDENVYCKNIIDRYAARPQKLEDMSLAEFAANYTYKRETTHDVTQCENGMSDGSDTELQGDNEVPQENSITLQNGLGYMRKRRKQAIIRWHNFNPEKEPEKHFRSRIMLFMPWREEDKLYGNYKSYTDRYHNEMDKIKKTEDLFIHHEEEINDAFQQLQTVGPPEDAWDNLAPGTEESQQVAHQEGITDERPMAEEDIQAHIKQIVNEQQPSKNDSLSLKYTKEARKELLTTQQYNKYMQHLNEDQKLVVMYHRKWCKEAVVALKENKPIKPYCLFLSGPGGVGKSHVVKLIHTDTVKLLQCAHQITAEDIPILLTAATGVAAHNINGITVHSAFMLNDRKSSHSTYYGLGADTLNTLQLHLEHLMVVIIDEISMIGADTLYKIHMRLQEIKGLTYSDTRFGNVTIIAVGDLYQLPPLKDKKIYDTPGSNYDPNPICLHGSLWQENFNFHELKHIVRQKDQQFAQLLNRVREAQITDDDDAVLKQRVTTLDDPAHFTDALHVYGTNNQTDQYNSTMLHKLTTHKYIIKSSDITKDRNTNQVQVSLEGKKRTDTGGLSGTLTVAENAFVRLTSNIDVADGLANGIRGIIKSILTNDQGSVTAILVQFDDKTVGEKAKASSQYKSQHPEAVPIYRHGVPFQHKNITVFRSQFPLVLAWASTIHSVQGLTVDRIVVDLSKIFAAGQAYVALSRVKTLHGLQILNYKRTAFKKDKRVEDEMLRLQSRAITFNLPMIPTLPAKQWIKVCHLNIRGYLNHVSDLKQDNSLCACDIICFTETHLRKTDVIHTNSQPNKDYIQYRKDRIAGVDKGGIIIFVHPHINSTTLDFNIPKLEFAATVISPTQPDELIIITIYRRSNSISTQHFTQMVHKLLSKPELEEKNILVLGDFNEDLMQDSRNICSFFKQYQFKQLIHQPTTNQGSLLDHIYFNGSSTTRTEVYDTYYSDHDATLLAIQKDNS